MYKEDKKAFVDVDDEDDFQLGMAQALNTKVPPEITFVVQFEKTATSTAATGTEAVSSDDVDMEEETKG